MNKTHLARFDSSIGILTNESVCGRIIYPRNLLQTDWDYVDCKVCLKRVSEVLKQ